MTSYFVVYILSQSWKDINSKQVTTFKSKNDNIRAPFLVLTLLVVQENKKEIK